MSCISYDEALTSTINIARKLVYRTVPEYLREEALAECNLSLLSAIRKFNPDRGVAFSSYVYLWYKDAINKTLNLSFKLAYPKDKYKDCVDTLHSLIFVDSNDVEIESGDYFDTNYIDDIKVVSKLLKHLDKTELIVIKQYYGIGCEPRSLTQITNGKCKQYNSVVYRRAMDKLKKAANV